MVKVKSTVKNYRISYQGPQADDFCEEFLPTWEDAHCALGELIGNIVVGPVRTTMLEMLRDKAYGRAVHLTDGTPHTFVLEVV